MPSRGKFAVYWARSAAFDLDSIFDSIVLESPETAERIFHKLEGSSRRLKLFPYRGRIVPELKAHGILAYHEMICAPWRIVYRIEGRTAWIMAVIDGRRNLEDLLLERFLQ